MSDLIKTQNGVLQQGLANAWGTSVRNSQQLGNEIQENIRSNNIIARKENEIIEANQKAEKTVEVMGNVLVAVITLKRENQELQERVEYYENLLTKPMLDIAKENGEFRKTYEKQQEILSDWIVSQEAFRELANIYGLEKLNKTKAELNEDYKKAEESVINNNTKFDNNKNKYI